MLAVRHITKQSRSEKLRAIDQKNAGQIRATSRSKPREVRPLRHLSLDFPLGGGPCCYLRWREPYGCGLRTRNTAPALRSQAPPAVAVHLGRTFRAAAFAEWFSDSRNDHGKDCALGSPPWLKHSSGKSPRSHSTGSFHADVYRSIGTLTSTIAPGFPFRIWNSPPNSLTLCRMPGNANPHTPRLKFGNLL